MKADKKLLKNIIILRVFAILLVVYGHSIIYYSLNWNLYQPPSEFPMLDIIKRIIDFIQMPLFIFISGYVYSFNQIEKNRYNGFLALTKNKAHRLLVPYLLVGLLWVFPLRRLANYSPYNKPFFKFFLFDLLLGQDIGNLWYLQALFLIFLVFYILKQLLRSNESSTIIIIN